MTDETKEELQKTMDKLIGKYNKTISQWNELSIDAEKIRNQVLESRRRLLIKKAHELGGTELVNSWIDLHVVGKKKDKLIQIAKELGFQ